MFSHINPLNYYYCLSFTGEVTKVQRADLVSRARTRVRLLGTLWVQNAKGYQELSNQGNALRRYFQK